MDIRLFLSNVIDSLAWPIAVVGLVLLLRKEIKAALAALAKLRYKDLELVFSRMEASAEKLPPPTTVPDYSPETRAARATLEEQLREISVTAPAAAILMAWAAVESAMSSAIARLSRSLGGPTAITVTSLLGELRKHGKLPNEVDSVIRDLRLIRNQVAHDGRVHTAIAPNSALWYTETSLKVVEYLNSLQP